NRTDIRRHHSIGGSRRIDPGFVADISIVVFTTINRFYPKAQLRTWSGHSLVAEFHSRSATQGWAGTHYNRLPGGRNSRTRARQFHERASADSFSKWRLQLAAICRSHPAQPLPCRDNDAILVPIFASLRANYEKR